jgi:aminoglycoside phosphotransferase family enzyme/predicted kinase
MPNRDRPRTPPHSRPPAAPGTAKTAETDSDQSVIIAFLSDPRSYGPGIEAVERHETHGAVVFLAGDRAYKLKRAVRYPYMDFSTTRLREAMCRRETEVNRAGAPGVYLGVRPILAGPDGPRFGNAAENEGALDWVVVMRRFPQEALLDALRKRGELPPDLMRRVGEIVADFHARAERVFDRGGMAGIAAVVEENASQLATFPELFDAAARTTLVKASRAQLGALAPLLDRRQRQGKVRRCHGDLHLNNIFVDDKGVPVLFDAIEFEDSFSCIDVLYDIAFLVMDLERHGLTAHANQLLNRYLEKTFDFEGLAALPLFLSCRAGLRAHVRATASRLASGDKKREAEDEARALFLAALSFLAPASPELVALGGPSGTGKTTLAYDLAPALGRAPGAVVVRSDIFRKHLTRTSETEHLPEASYTQAARSRVYDELLSAAATVLPSGYSAIVDAVHGRQAERAAVEAVAVRAGVRFRGLWLEAPQEILEKRIRSRQGDASDATVDVLRSQLGTILVPDNWARVDCSEDERQALRNAERALF